MLTLEGLQVRHVGPVTLSVAAGECIGLSGPSGSGKTLLLRAVADLVKRHGCKLAGVVVGHFDYPESGIANRVAITQHALGEMSLVEDMHKLGSSLFSRRRMLVLNADHPAVIRCMELAQHEPEFSAYLLVKLFFLGTQLNPVVDAALAQHAMERRCRRST